VIEKEWLACKEPAKMLAHLGVDEHWGYVQQSRHVWVRSRKKNKLDRALRLFACACCRRIWDLITHEAGHEAVETAEEFADGNATRKQLREANSAATACTMDDEEIVAAALSQGNGLELCRSNQALMAAVVASAETCNPLFAAQNAAEASGNEKAERAAQCNLLRDVIGNPFHVNSGKTKRSGSSPSNRTKRSS
jgi:hypothetical protein